VTDFLRLDTDALQCYATAAYPCSYLPEQMARSQVVAPGQPLDTARYAALIPHGFRRSGLYVYKPHCDHCQACQSIRIPVTEFVPNRSQQRAWRQHRHLITRVVKPEFSPEHFELYRRYQHARHPNEGMDVDDADQYTDFLIASHVDTCLVEFRAPGSDLAGGTLKMVSVIDRFDHALSAVYTFYAPEPGQSLGTYNVLWQIAWARRLGLEHLYLGFWIQACHKMSYKSRFRPHDVLSEGSWQRW